MATVNERLDALTEKVIEIAEKKLEKDVSLEELSCVCDIINKLKKDDSFLEALKHISDGWKHKEEKDNALSEKSENEFKN